MSDRNRTVRLVAGLGLLFGALVLFTGVVTIGSPTVTLAVAVLDLGLGLGLLASARDIVPTSTPTESQ